MPDVNYLRFPREPAWGEKLSEEQFANACRLWRAGLDTYDIAVEIGASEPATYNALSKVRDRQNGWERACHA